MVPAVFLSFVLYCHFEMDPVPVFQRRTSSRTRHFHSAGAERIKRKTADKTLKALTYKSVRLCFCAAMKRLNDSEAHMTHIHTAAWLTVHTCNTSTSAAASTSFTAHTLIRRSSRTDVCFYLPVKPASVVYFTLFSSLQVDAAAVLQTMM